MLGARTAKRGEWTLLLLQLPGEQPIPGGVLVLDPTDDRLYVRLRTDLADIDPDVALVWDELEADLIQKAAEMGGLNVMRWLEEEASNTILTGDRQEIQMARPEHALDELFSLHIQSFLRLPHSKADFGSQRAFSAADIAAACEKLPISKLAGIRALKACEEPTWSFEKIAEVVARDPGLSAHLIKVGNLASVSRGPEVRSVSQALTRIGLDQAKLHIWAISMKNLYSLPHLQTIWNHSLRTVDVVDELCQHAGYADTADARLLALLHDIGHLVLSALGPSYMASRAKLLAEGLYPVEIEHRLCGLTHAAIGADLLSSWQFPKDMVEAVRYHHNPSDSGSALTSLVYCGECWTDNGEDIYNPIEHDAAIDVLGLKGINLHLGTQHRPDLNLLRFAA
jgi:putative nucleotidyltransferase with HDIG domain